MVHDADVVNQLRESQPCAFDLLYTTYYPSIEKYILSNQGAREDAQDIFQEALLILHKNIAREDFQLTSSLKTYLYAISKNLWLKTLRQRKLMTSLENQESDDPTQSAYVDQPQDNDDRTTHFVQQLLARIPLHCQKIIRYVFYQNEPVDKVALKMGYNNPHTASNIKYKCIQQIKKVSIKSNLKKLL